MIYFLLSVIGILITISFVIGIHEYGHFIIARLLHVRVARFSIGFGKVLRSWHDRKGTEYALSILPLGGYVSLEEKCYQQAPYYKKFLIVLAGPAINLLSAWLLYWCLFTVGITTVKPVIGNITPHSIAAEAGLEAQDEIIQIDHEETRTWTGVLLRLVAHAGNQDQATITIKNKNNAIKSLTLNLAHWKLDDLSPDPLTSLGIQPATQFQLIKIQYAPLPALFHAGKEIVDFTYFNLLLFGKLFTGKLSLQGLGGPLTIFESAAHAFNAGWIAFMGFLAFLSISIGIINLFPIPGLDGGHLFIQTIESLIRRPIPERIMTITYRLGFSILVVIFTIALVNDLLRLF